MISLEDLGILTGIISAFFGGMYFVFNLITKKRLRIRKKISGKWTNAGEASVDDSETHNLELELEVDLEDGEISGVLKSSRIDGKSISPLCSVVGKLGYKSSQIELWYSRHYGEGVIYGKATISLNKKVMIWNLKNGTADFFPDHTVLFKNL